MLPYIKELLCNCSLFHPTDFQFMESNELLFCLNDIQMLLVKILLLLLQTYFARKL